MPVVASAAPVAAHRSATEIVRASHPDPRLVVHDPVAVVVATVADLRGGLALAHVVLLTDDCCAGPAGHAAEAVVVLVTAHSRITAAVEAMKLGAVDFVEKPWQNEKLLATLQAAAALRRSRIEAAQLRKKNRELSAETARPRDVTIGASPAMLRVLEVIAKAAPTDANVLITGENGTGKELAAREIHRQSQRSDAAFVSVDLGALSESLAPSDLFGHKKGAFTGANEDRIGRFASAGGGTLFLDEIGNIPREFQAKLLTALERREVVPLGSNTPIPIDVRVISATNLPAEKLHDEAVFRQDLLYRLNTIELALPPLRERAGDIGLIVEHFSADM